MVWEQGCPGRKISGHMHAELLYDVLPTEVSCSFASSTPLAG